MKNNRVKVLYTVKNVDGYIVDRSVVFENLQKAARFVYSAPYNEEQKIVGKPTIIAA